MSRETRRPSTMDGIKRLAKSIKAEQGIPHLQALDEAAKVAGYQNFKHARHVLGTTDREHLRSSPGQSLYLTIYWHDKKVGTRGRETLPTRLGTVWSELITPAQLGNHPALIHFKPEGPDHLARHDLAQSQSQARRAICAAARTFQFMDATKLRPSKSHSRAFPGGRSSNAIPGRDHYSVWYERGSKRYLFADEPYESAVESRAAERSTWSARHGFNVVKPSWPGMYNPDGGSRLYLVSDAAKGVPLAPIIAALDRLPSPVIEAAWNGESVPSTKIFISPGTVDRNEAVVSKPTIERRTTVGPRNTVAYVQTLVGPQRRPNGRMPIEVHAQIGGLLKSVLTASYYRKGVYNRVNKIRSELDEWVQREFSPSELPHDQFSELYYQETGASFARTISANERAIHVNSLEQIKVILPKYYPDCPPLRTLIKTLNTAITSMQTWVP